jgi:hypothetical protein
MAKRAKPSDDYESRVKKLVGEAPRYPSVESMRQAVASALELAECLRLLPDTPRVGLHVEMAADNLARHFNPLRLPFDADPQFPYYKGWPGTIEAQHIALHTAFKEIVRRGKLRDIYEGRAVTASRGKDVKRLPANLLTRLVQSARKVEQGLAVLPDEDDKEDHNTQAQLPSVDEEDLRILWTLAHDAPRRLTQDQIEGRSGPGGISKKTISKRMPVLEKKKLVRRPDGKKAGYELTPLGYDLLRRDNPAEFKKTWYESVL